MKKIVQIFVVLLVALSFTLVVSGCGSSGGSDASISTTTGQFIDDPVQGLNYTCSSGATGVTNMSGEYTCNVGDDVTFSIGTADIGTITAGSGIITPYSLFPNDLDAAINLARLLQSLDNDPSDDIIILDAALVALLPADLDFSSETFEADVESALGITLVSAEDAQNQLNDAIVIAGEDIPEIGYVPITDGDKETPIVNHIPVANAGIDQNVNTADIVTLDGSGSSSVNGNALTYSWSITSTPTDSVAMLSDTTAINPTFVADKDGSYVIRLIVNNGVSNSAADTVTITATTNNAAPVANAGIDQDVNTTNIVDLNGSASSDAEGDTLTYSWSITSTPTSSTATLSDATIVNPTFTADKDGSYEVQLIVNDGTVDSAADTVTVTAETTILHNGTIYGMVTSPGGRVWLDRNLGASQVCTAYNDAACYGDYYQWGRNFDGHEKSNSELNSTLATDVNNAGDDFIAGFTVHDWASVDAGGATRVANWSATDGSSVCPVGFRVPSQTELRNDTINRGVTNRATAFSSFLKLPAAGSRSYHRGNMEMLGATGIYATNSVSASDEIYYLGFNETAAGIGSMYFAYGRVIRCIKN